MLWFLAFLDWFLKRIENVWKSVRSSPHQFSPFLTLIAVSDFPWHALLIAHLCHLPFLSKIFNHELFGALAEEKEVKQILSKVMEARRSKSYDSYEILGKFVGKEQVTKLILPLKEVRI